MSHSQLKKLITFGALANATLELDKLLHFLVNAISKLVNAEAGSVLLLDGDELIFAVATGEKSDSLTRMRLPRERSIAWWVVDNRRTYISNDTSREPMFSGSVDRQIGFSTKKLIAVPIMLADELVGVMEAVNKRRGNFNDKDRSLLEAFAELVAVAIKNAQKFSRLKSTSELIISEMEEEYLLIGVSPAIDEIRKVIAMVAPTPSTVLITGESGVGKEVVARQIHIHSERADGPFVKVSCPSFPETLLESELFGHEKGAYTGATRRRIGRFEAARGGTIFLDEIGELPMSVQAKLLRVLQDGVFERLGSNEQIRTDARVIAATNKNLQDEMAQKNFRKDLFFRLNVVPIHIPPLRERREDIPPLVEHFIVKLRRKFPHRIKSVSPEAMEIMQRYDWPGNIRELENTIERIAVLYAPERIEPKHLPPEITGEVHRGPQYSHKGTLQNIEREAIENALRETKGNQSKAAEMLGISRDKLRYRIRVYGINPKKFKGDL